MNNIMIDIETLGNNCNSAILQISMVKFDENGNIGDKLSINIDTKEQLKLGAETTESTINWWKDTNITLFERLQTENLISVDEAIKQINSFITFYDKLWCHASFDLPIIGNMYRLSNKRTPWNYKLLRDIRTIVDLSGIDLSTYDWSNKTHNSLDDCLFQIKYVTDAMKKLKHNNSSTSSIINNSNNIIKDKDYYNMFVL